ncbi:iron chelate uptake ABC transporter family permease subunit [Methanolobus psychrotolerans]|uniref:iron chelate uptake ABC transporter family permease subunit n=1 Tax=Methanolobus psychrotolerans TaxID=1874706 RepID=UPI0030F46457
MMQVILRNLLASPYTLGISSAAGFGAAVAITLGAGFAGGEYLIVGNAFIGESFCQLRCSCRKSHVSHERGKYKDSLWC